jgi:3-dehydroquinate synthase
MVKKKVIEEDEYESDLRRILNYGHTFGHALEAETNHFVPHGLGVMWGIDFVNFFAFEKGWLEQSKYSRIKKVILNHFGFKNTKAVSAEGLLTAARRDKKAASASEVNMVYFTENNCLEIKKTALDEEFKSLLERYLLNEDVFYRS